MLRCIGCDENLPGDGKENFRDPCSCGATIFYNPETGLLALPHFLGIALLLGKGLPHLDYLIGESDYTSPAKQAMTRALTASGAIWMKDCEQCRQNGVDQKELAREKRLALLEAEKILREGG